MIKNIKGISLCGRYFSSKAVLEFYTDSTHRLSIVYGKNGSGKSTIAEAIENISKNIFHDVSAELIDEKKNAITFPAEQPFPIFVFNEKYIDENIKVTSDGLETIVLLGSQVDLQKQIEEYEEKEKTANSELATATEKLDTFNDPSAPQSPEYQYEQIKKRLQQDWAKRDAEIKENKISSAAKEGIINEILAIEIPKNEDSLSQEFLAKKQFFEKIPSLEVNIPMPPDKIKISSGFEENLRSLLNKKIEAPSFTPREEQILNAVLSGQQRMIEEAKQTFSTGESTICPYCYQEVGKEYGKNLLESINRVLNKDVDNHKSELNKITFPSANLNYSQYSSIDSNLLQQIKNKQDEYADITKRYNEQIEKKINNIYNAIELPNLGLEKVIEDMNALLDGLGNEIANLTKARDEREHLKEELLNLNKTLAAIEIKDIKITYLEQRKKKDDAISEQREKAENLSKIKKKLDELNQKKENVHLAVNRINESLAYIFFDSNRLKIEFKNQKYIITSNGRPVSPKQVSVGERNIIALCYFFTEILSNRDIRDAYKNEQFVVIDDPISSFDFENKVGVVSFIRSQVEKIMMGNTGSKVLILSHDLTTVFNLRKVASETANKKYSFLELKNKQLTPISGNYSEYKKLLDIIYNYASGKTTSERLTIGNIMRRVLEAFSTFNYRKGIIDIFSNPLVSKALKSKASYFKNRMLRLILNGESHTEEQIYSLHDSANLHIFTSDEEKQRCAKDILCFMLLLNQAHIESYLGESALEDIRTWSISIQETPQENTSLTGHV